MHTASTNGSVLKKTHHHIFNISPEIAKSETATDDSEEKISSFILLSTFFGKKSCWQSVNMSLLQKISTTASQGQERKEYKYNLHEKFTFTESHSKQYTTGISACLDFTRENNLVLQSEQFVDRQTKFFMTPL